MRRLAFILVIGIVFSNEVSAGLFDKPIQPPCGEKVKSIFPVHFAKKGHAIQFLKGGEYGITQIDSTSKRLGAALIAIPLGMLGMHRIYLGTKPIVPIFYILTFGGGFGILPFIDFVVLIISDDVKPFINNPRIFMWSNQ